MKRWTRGFTGLLYFWPGAMTSRGYDHSIASSSHVNQSEHLCPAASGAVSMITDVGQGSSFARALVAVEQSSAVKINLR